MKLLQKTISMHNGSAANRDHNIQNPKATDIQEHMLEQYRVEVHDVSPKKKANSFGEALQNHIAVLKTKSKEHEI